MENFGTEYSSLAYLTRLTIITYTSWWIALSSPGSAETSRAPRMSRRWGLGRAMGLGVVYESVGTEEQRARLLELGFDFAQGYFVA